MENSAILEQMSESPAESQAIKDQIATAPMSSAAIDDAPLVVLISGMFRSGSTWSFNIARELLQMRFGQKGVYTLPSEDLRTAMATREDRPVVVMKGHFLDEFGRNLIRKSQAKVIHTVRSPMDAIRSGIRAFGIPFEQCLVLVEQSFVLLDEIVAARNGYVILFEDISDGPEVLVERIASYLNVLLEPGDCRRLVQKYSRNCVREFTDRLFTAKEAITAERSIVDIGFSYFDAETLFHRSHIGSEAPPDLSEGEVLRTLDVLRTRVDNDGKLLLRESLFFS